MHAAFKAAREEYVNPDAPTIVLLTALGHLGQALAHQLVSRRMGNVFAHKLDGAGLGAQQARDGLERCGLTSTVRTDQSNDLALVDVKGDVLDGVDGAVPDVDVVDGKHRLCHLVLPLILLAQICLDNGVVVLDFLGRALGDDLTKVEHADTLANIHDERHVVLDKHDGNAEGVANLDDVLHELRSLKGREYGATS